MYRRLEEIRESVHQGHAFFEIFEEVLGSKKLLDEFIGPFEIFSLVGYSARINDYLDMTTSRWKRLSLEKQIKYARAYQQWYARGLKVNVHQTFPCGRLPLEMQLIPPGKYWKEEAPVQEGEPSLLKKVWINSPFWCSRYLITQAQWSSLMGSNPAYFKGEELPIENITWEESKQFLEKLGHSFQFLKENQWEYACRAGVSASFHFGNDVRLLEHYGWYHRNASRQTHPVGQKSPNAWGLYDMHGNAWEWCEDFFFPSPVSSDTPSPSEEHVSLHRIARGGSWYCEPTHCHSSYRVHFEPKDHNSFTSLRVACSFSQPRSS